MMTETSGGKHSSFSLERRDVGPREGCEAVLRVLPDWFGDEASLVEYVKRLGELPTVLAVADGAIVGFASLDRHFDEAAEIHVMGVRPEWHGRGVGRALVEDSVAWLESQGVRVLQVKTLGPSVGDANYDRTLGFYRALGFERVEELKNLWGSWPCLLLVKALDPRRSSPRSGAPT